MYKCIVVDDDPISRISIRNLVKNHRNLEFVFEAEEAQSAITYIEENNVDLIFLDVLMPDVNGFELIKMIDKSLKIIVISEYREFALDAFSFDVVDYLKKPILAKRFNEAIDRYERLIRDNKPDTIRQEGVPQKSDVLFLKIDGIFRKISLGEIVYIENDGNYVNIHTEKETLSPYGTIKEIESKLPSTLFLKPHRKFIVSIDHINGVDDNFIITSKKLIPISRDRRKVVQQLLGLK